MSLFERHAMMFTYSNSYVSIHCRRRMRAMFEMKHPATVSGCAFGLSAIVVTIFLLLLLLFGDRSGLHTRKIRSKRSESRKRHRRRTRDVDGSGGGSVCAGHPSLLHEEIMFCHHSFVSAIVLDANIRRREVRMARRSGGGGR